MTLPQSDRQISDPETLSNLHRLFQSCWQEVAAKLSSSLDSESESSLRRTIASRILREAGQGETDDQELRRKALFGILDRPNAQSPTASSMRIENGT
jgi:hypothetical protein